MHTIASVLPRFHAWFRSIDSGLNRGNKKKGHEYMCLIPEAVVNTPAGQTRRE
jgi:hypothetical protein